MSTRRDFLKMAGALIVGLAVGGGIGYSLAPKQAPTKPLKPAPPVTKEKTIKAAWIYVGPISDYGWSHAHEIGRRECEKTFSWLESICVENITREKTTGTIEELISKGYTVIFTTSFDHMEPTYLMAQKYPDIMFFHCSGYKRRANMATYFADLYQCYYINGLIAGALTKTNKIGYVAAHLIPEVIRHINAFTIGINEVNPKAKVYVIEIGQWYYPKGAREAASTLVEQIGVDVLAFTEDSPATIQYAEELYKEKKKLVPVFSHYSPMYNYGPDVVVSGQVAWWAAIYKDILSKVYAGMYTPHNLENVDYWWLLSEGAVDVGMTSYHPSNPPEINSKFLPILSNITIREKYTGEVMSVVDLVKLRYNQMKNGNIDFDPFTGPLKGKWWLGEGGECLGKKYSKNYRCFRYQYK